MERLTDEDIKQFQTLIENDGSLGYAAVSMIIADLRYYKQLSEKRGKALEWYQESFEVSFVRENDRLQELAALIVTDMMTEEAFDEKWATDWNYPYVVAVVTKTMEKDDRFEAGLLKAAQALARMVKYKG